MLPRGEGCWGWRGDGSRDIKIFQALKWDMSQKMVGKHCSTKGMLGFLHQQTRPGVRKTGLASYHFFHRSSLFIGTDSDVV